MIVRNAKIPFEKQVSWIILSGLIWGLIELFFGPPIKSFTKSLFGILMPFIGITFMLSVKYKMPTKGTIFLAAIIASLIKYFFSGMVLTGGFMAILFEAAAVEFVYSFSGLTLWGFILSGILAQLYSFFHPYFTNGMMCQSVNFLYLKNMFMQNFNLIVERRMIIYMLSTSSVIAGILSGFLAWWIIRFWSAKETN